MTLKPSKTKKPGGVFIVGTDTGIGKTVLGTALARAYLTQGRKVFPRKPVETGCVEQDGRLMAADGLLYAEATQRAHSLETITPYCFTHAVSAERAARLMGVSLTIADLRQAILQNVPADGMIIAEGAGGFLSPLATDGSNADLAVALSFPLILVVGDRLGCINHALLTLEAIEKRQLIVAAMVFNDCDKKNDAALDNPEDLSRYTSVPIVRLEHLEATGAGLGLDVSIADRLVTLINVHQQEHVGA